MNTGKPLFGQLDLSAKSPPPTLDEARAVIGRPVAAGSVRGAASALAVGGDVAEVIDRSAGTASSRPEQTTSAGVQSDLDEVTAIRRRLLANGFQPVAVKTGEKRPVAGNWQQAQGLPTARPGAMNTGVLARGLRPLDVDVDDPEAAAFVVATIERVVGPTTCIRTRANSARSLMLYRAAEGEAPGKKTIQVPGGKVEILGDGQQFVAYGRHPTGVEMEWQGGGPDAVRRDALPVMTRAQEAELVAALSGSAGTTSPATRSAAPGKRGQPAPNAELLRRLGAAMPNNGPFDDRDSFVDVLYAIRGAAGDDLVLAVEVAEEWADRWHLPGKPEEARRVIETMTQAPATGWDELLGLLDQHAPEVARKIRHEVTQARFSGEPADAGGLTPAQVTSMNERFALVANIGLVDLKADDASGSLFRVRQVPEFKLHYDGQKVALPGPKGTRFVGLGTYWLGHEDARRAERVGLWPVGKEPPNSINLFRGLAVQPRAGQWDTAREFIFNVIADGNLQAAEFFLNWIAAGLQHPLDRAETAVALVGDRGTGKGTMLGMLAGVYSPQHTFTASNPDHILGRFNSHLEGCLLLNCEESLFGRDVARLGQFKALVTEPTLTIEGKYQQARVVPNRLKIVIATNDLAGVPVEAGDRRVSVLEVSSIRRQDTGYFAGLKRAWEGGEREAFLHDMLARDLSNFDRRQPLRTAARRAVAEATARPLVAWWIEVVDKGVLPGSAELALERGQPLAPDAWSNGPVMTRFSDLLDDARRHLRRERHTPGKSEVSQLLKELCPDRARKQPRVAGGAQIEALEFPRLDVCRAALDRALGGSGDEG